jgi:hypothetical protein
MAIFYEIKLEEGGVKKNSRKGVLGKKNHPNHHHPLLVQNHHFQVVLQTSTITLITTKPPRIEAWKFSPLPSTSVFLPLTINYFIKITIIFLCKEFTIPFCFKMLVVNLH